MNLKHINFLLNLHPQLFGKGKDRSQFEVLAAKDQKINVAGGSRFVAGIGAEDINLADTLFFSQRLHDPLNIVKG